MFASGIGTTVMGADASEMEEVQFGEYFDQKEKRKKKNT